MSTWFTSDLHLGHLRIIELCNRPFASIDEMNQAIIDRWNDVVSEQDRVYVLGDVAMGKLAESLPLIDNLKGTKFLVPGNHDRCWSGYPKHYSAKRRDIDFTRYEDVGFKILGEQMVHANGWLLCHFPYEGDSTYEERYKEYRPIDKGGWVVHGHVHNEWTVNGRQINVGVDQWDFTPVHENQIKEIIREVDGGTAVLRDPSGTTGEGSQ